MLLHNERRFTADAAHELRTPIAAIRMQAQVVLGADAQSPDRTQALSQVLAGCDRASHLVEQVTDPGAAGAGSAVGWACARGCRGPYPQCAGRLGTGRTGARADADLDGADTVLLAVAPTPGGAGAQSGGQRPALQPAGAQIQVHWRQDRANSACLEVHDSGPGLNEADSARLGSASFGCWAQASGSGLGWSIVRRIAQVQGATVQAQAARPRGLQVSVCWPLAA